MSRFRYPFLNIIYSGFRNRIDSLILFMLVIMLISACDRNKLFEENTNLNDKVWRIEDTISFRVVVRDTSSYHNILINIRNEGNYPYRNLYLFVHVTSPTGASVTDTLDIELADARGKWNGSGLGDMFFLQVPYKTKIRFPVPGLYSFSIIQGMRKDDLKGIRNVGIRIEKAIP